MFTYLFFDIEFDIEFVYHGVLLHGMWKSGEISIFLEAKPLYKLVCPSFSHLPIYSTGHLLTHSPSHALSNGCNNFSIMAYNLTIQLCIFKKPVFLVFCTSFKFTVFTLKVVLSYNQIDVVLYCRFFFLCLFFVYLHFCVSIFGGFLNFQLHRSNERFVLVLVYRMRGFYPQFAT